MSGMSSVVRKGLGFVLATVLAGLSGQALAQVEAQKYVRVGAEESGDRSRLEVSVRTLKPSGAGPVVHLVGVVHIGDAAYYAELQKFLNEQEVVLFEGVKPAGMGAAGEDGDADDAAKAKLTKSRVRMLALFFERHRGSEGKYPESVDALIAAQKGTAARILAGSRVDAWGREILLERSQTRILEGTKELWAGEEIDFISRGSDGREGGEGSAADLRFSQQEKLTKAERSSKAEGIQPKLARALGLEFQLAVIDYTREGWRNSDMTVDEVQQKLKEEGVSADALFGMLDGGGFGGAVMGMLMGFIERDPAMSAMVKLMMVETLANADRLMESQPERMQKMTKVILVDRNEVVLADLKKLLENEPGVKSVALFYGAGHLPHMEDRLVKDFGYTFDSDRWFTAMDVDLTKVKGGKAQAKQIREMMKKMGEKKAE